MIHQDVLESPLVESADVSALLPRKLALESHEAGTLKPERALLFL